MKIEKSIERGFERKQEIINQYIAASIYEVKKILRR